MFEIQCLFIFFVILIFLRLIDINVYLLIYVGIDDGIFGLIMFVLIGREYDGINRY